MIKKINIKNFKSVEDLELELGRLNVIIGANGSGKTNILEAIVMGAAANAHKLDYEFLGNRIRITSPEFMQNAFPDNKENDIQIDFFNENNEYLYNLINDKEDNKKWIDVSLINSEYNTILEELQGETINNTKLHELKTMLLHRLPSKEISEFLIYTPELSYLKRFEEFSQITPLGVKGEGLFSLLKQIVSNKRRKKQITDIKENLHLLDWFDDFDIPANLMSNELKIAIKVRFIKS